MERKCCGGITNINEAYTNILKYDGKITDTKAFYSYSDEDGNNNFIQHNDYSRIKVFYGNRINNNLLNDYIDNIYNNAK